MDYSNKENIPTSNNKIFEQQSIVPNLNLKISERNSLSPGNLSYSSRMKKRSQNDRTLDLCVFKCKNITPKVLKANHNIVPILTYSQTISRKKPGPQGILINNRKVSKNIFLDKVPS